jgi:hypothetical protein
MRVRRLLAVLTTACFLNLSLQSAATAGVMGPAHYLPGQDRAGQIARIDALVARADVAEQLQRLGVSPADASERARLLTDEELRSLTERLDSLPAGGDSLFAVIGIVFVVLLILEITGVVDIFKRV